MGGNDGKYSVEDFLKELNMGLEEFVGVIAPMIEKRTPYQRNNADMLRAAGSMLLSSELNQVFGAMPAMLMILKMNDLRYFATKDAKAANQFNYLYPKFTEKAYQQENISTDFIGACSKTMEDFAGNGMLRLKGFVEEANAETAKWLLKMEAIIEKGKQKVKEGEIQWLMNSIKL